MQLLQFSKGLWQWLWTTGLFSTSSEVRVIIPAFQKSVCCCLQLVDYHYYAYYTVTCPTQNWYNEIFYFICHEVLPQLFLTFFFFFQILLIWLLNSCVSYFVSACCFSCYGDDTFVINIFLIVAHTYNYCHNRLYQLTEKVV